MTLEREIEWLVDRVLKHYPYLEEKGTPNQARDWLTLRITWGCTKGFTYFWGDKMGTLGAILIRPLTDALLERVAGDYWKTIWDFDPHGDICWIDFAYGAGLQPNMLRLCQSTGCKRLGWEHRNRLHIRPITRIPVPGMKRAFHL